MQLPEHCQAYQLVEAITGINKSCTAWLSILSQYPCGFQFQQTPYQSPLFRLRIALLDLRPLSLFHLLSSYLHSSHYGFEIVARPVLPSLPLFL